MIILTMYYITCVKKSGQIQPHSIQFIGIPNACTNTTVASVCQDRRCGRKRGGRQSSNATNLLHHAAANNASRLDMLDDGAAYDEIYSINIRGKKLYDFLYETKHSYLRTHPEYAARYPDVDEDMMR